MSENMALLSQSEIDILVNFLTDRKNQVSSEVMEQRDIDRLISLLKSGNGSPVRLDTGIPETSDTNAVPILLVEDTIEAQQKCELKAELSKDNYMVIQCVNSESGKRFLITPSCMTGMNYKDGDRSQWGRAIPPIMFDKIATLLKVKYSKATFDFICNQYKKIIYGENSQEEIPGLFMPSASLLVSHLL